MLFENYQSIRAVSAGRLIPGLVRAIGNVLTRYALRLVNRVNRG